MNVLAGNSTAGVCSFSEPLLPCLLCRPSNTVGKFGPGSYEVSTFLAESWCTQTLVCTFKSGASVYLCRIPVIKLCWPLKLDFLEVPPPAVRPTGCKSWPGAHDHSPLGRIFMVPVFSSLGHQLREYRI